MSTKRRSSDTNKGKSAKKNKEGEVAVLSSDLEDEVIRNGMKEAWRKKTSFSHGSVQLDCEPFPHCKIRNFVQNDSFVENLRDELLRLNFHSKSNDLYKFQQSDDLRKRKEHHISEIRSLLFLRFRSWLSDVLGVDLEPTVDISCAKYEHTGSVQLDCEPFPHCKIRNFVQNDSFVENLRDELLRLNFHSKSNDLYKFQQSDDLRKRKEHHISEIRSLLFLRFRSWLSDVLGVDLEPTVDISCAKYEHTGNEITSCSVSEVLTDEKCRLSLSGWFHGPSLQRPRRYTEPSVPRHTHVLSDESVLFEWVNEMYMDPLYQAQVQQEFEDTSEIRLPNFLQEEKYKQVSEVLTDEKCRLSLSGWFHGPSLQRPRRYTEPSVPRHTHVLSDESVLFEWVNEMYMDPLYQAQVQQEFEDTSEIRLPNFLQEEKYKQVIEALRLAEIQWERRGPPNKRCYARAQLQNLPSCLKECWDLLSSEACYARAQLQNLPSCLKECWDLLSSEAFFLLLSNLTGLSLHALAPGDDDSDSEGHDGASEGRDGASEGRDGQSEGRDGQSEGRDGQSEGRDGESKGRDGASEGRDGQSEGRDGQSEGQDGESNTDNGEDERNGPDGQGPRSTSSSTEKKNKGPPVCVGELRRWSHGDYTLLHDSVKREFALDLLLHLGCTGWKAEFGGFTAYVAHDEDEELLTVYPEENSLALVYRDKETLKFVKHVNHNGAVSNTSNLRKKTSSRCYARAQLQNLPSCLKECWDLLSSEAFFLLLSNLTGLSLHALAPGDDDSDSEGHDGASEGRDGQSEGRDGQSEGRDGESKGRDGASEGRDGQSEGRDGQSEGRDGQSEGRDGQSEGQDGQSEGRDGQSEGQDGESNTDNGEDERNGPDGQGPRSTSSSTEEKNKGPPVCVGELRRWSHGDYTLLHDSVKREFALDLLLHLGCTGWKAEFGGFTAYVAHDEDEELLTVYPEENSLALVYRDKETLKFVKHVNHNGAGQEREDALTHFYDFSFTYYE
ncbi:hypothetical protein PDJAM_G00022380 [Pangasius djambal]|uniref:Uncharacterized protein n=1 Tax=Pangasius djambal TaxID=1691987 RepID=A0ACC5YNQ4_9TELE|nr:hypothetical protein [Pangasius djambal]